LTPHKFVILSAVEGPAIPPVYPPPLDLFNHETLARVPAY